MLKIQNITPQFLHLLFFLSMPIVSRLFSLCTKLSNGA
ncbi:uncharacterized protein METZ01_LOCUS462323, partial [marine metagenome]